MRGFHPDPKRFNTMKGERGWAVRQAEAIAKMTGSAEWREADAIRQAAYAERERAALAEAEKRRIANARLRVTCPCCGGGAMPVERAELILAALDRAPMDESAKDRAIRDKDVRQCPVCDSAEVNSELADRLVEALSRLPANREVDCSRIGNLIAVAQGEPYYAPDAIRPKNGAKYPRRAAPVADAVIPVETEASTVEAQTEDEAIAAVRDDKPVRRYVAPPHLED